MNGKQFKSNNNSNCNTGMLWCNKNKRNEDALTSGNTGEFSTDKILDLWTRSSSGDTQGEE